MSFFFSLVSQESLVQNLKLAHSVFTSKQFVQRRHSCIRTRSIQVSFWLPKFCPQFMPLGDHMSSYVNTLKTGNVTTNVCQKHGDIQQSLRGLSGKKFFACDRPQFNSLAGNFDFNFFMFKSGSSSCSIICLLVTCLRSSEDYSNHEP